VQAQALGVALVHGTFHDPTANKAIAAELQFEEPSMLVTEVRARLAA
jgi:hypothetical protein